MKDGLSIRDVSVSYGAVEALRSVTLEVERGEIACVIGHNGAGKSTLIRAICGQVPLAAGAISWRGKELGARSPVEIARLGVVQCPEGRQLFNSLTVAENIEMGASRRGVPIRRLKDDLDAVFALFPVVRERWKQKAGTLSGGEQQMVAVARSLIARPELLLVDEPALGLSPKMLDRLFRTLPAVAGGGVTLLVVEQNARAALRVARRGYVLHAGRVMFEGTSGMLRDELEGRGGYLE